MITDKNEALKALKIKNIRALEDISPELRGDPKIFWEAVKQCYSVLKFVSPELKKELKWLLEFESPNLQKELKKFF